MSFEQLARRLKPAFLNAASNYPEKPFKLFLAASDMKERAITRHAVADNPEDAWNAAVELLKSALGAVKPIILRADWVKSVEPMTFDDFIHLLRKTRRNYFRKGVAFDPQFKIAFTESELNGNAMLFKDGKDGSAVCVIRPERCEEYCRTRFNCDFPKLNPSDPVVVFETVGAFVSDEEKEPLMITGTGLDAGHRNVSNVDSDAYLKLARSGALYLAKEVKPNGRFIYGHYPCTGKIVPGYNTLRHFSSIFAMLDVYETYGRIGNSKLGAAINKALAYGIKTFIQYRTLDDGSQAAYPVDLDGNEIKLGALGMSLVALAKHSVLMKTKKHLPLMEAIARGIWSMQKPDGSFVHVLNGDDYSLKEPFRIVYYDGEAVFGMMRLYALNHDEKLREASELAFKRFIATNHWKNHDHWLSYAVNELTTYQPKREYFEFGINNFLDFLTFIYHRDTQFPTLLELMMAADTMIERLKKIPEMSDLLARIPLDDFYASAESRAKNLLNGHFYPELAMFFKIPDVIDGSFFIRHQAFRVRTDDVEHFLSAFVAYRRYLAHRDHDPIPSEALLNGKAEGTGMFNINSTNQTAEDESDNRIANAVDDKKKSVEPPDVAEIIAPPPADFSRQSNAAVIFYGGDVNLGRRMHAQVKAITELNKLDVMRNADFRLINLECVIATGGEQGINKDEGGPYYFRARPEQTNLLIQLGVDAVLTANNHAGDYGSEALIEQSDYLDRAGILHAGSGADVNEAARPIITKINGLTVAIFSVDATMKYFAASEDRGGTWFIPIDRPEKWTEAFADKLAAAHKQADLVIVAPHWGLNGLSEPSDTVKKIGRLLIDLGADVVLGCHSHLVQGVENYKGRPIVYDAGDFLFDARGRAKFGGCFTLTADYKGVRRIEFTPLMISYRLTNQPDAAQIEKINNEFIAACKKMNTTAVQTENGTVAIDFQPLKRIGQLIAPLKEPKPQWIVDRVPEEAQIEPQQFGELKMIGCRIDPHCLFMTERRMIFVETYWTIDQPTKNNYLFAMTGVPQRLCFSPNFGAGMDHEGCDWMFPTNRWSPGVIYYERFGLRPPDLKNMINSKFRLEICVQLGKIIYGPYVDPHEIEVRLPIRPYYKTEFPDSVYHSEPGKCWTAQQLKDVVDGEWIVEPPPGWYVNSVVRGIKHIDMLPSPTLFVANNALQLNFHEGTSGKSRADTHERLKEIVSRTAGAIVDHHVEDLPADYPQLLVDDPIKALVELGLAARKRFRGKVIGITGTVGKSSVSAMLAHALQNKKCITTYDNYNSRVGVPIVLSSLAQDYDYAIIEMAQSGLWMMRGPITVDINPDITVITQIGMSQTNNKAIRSINDVAKFKARAFMGLTENGVAIFHDQLACFDYVDGEAKKYSARQIICGSTDKATSKILEIKDTPTGHDVRASIEGEEVQFSVEPHGMASVMNMMLVLGVLKALGEDLTAAIELLSNYHALYGRLEYKDVQFDGKDIRVIDDSWNAEVLSFKRALDAAPYMKKPQGRLIGVLGRIVHLGDMARELHQSLRDAVIATKFDYIVTHGDEMKYLREVLPTENLGPHFSDAPALVEHLKTILQEDDTIVIKGSRRDSDFGTIGLILMGEKVLIADN